MSDSQVSFWQKLFRGFHELRRGEEPETFREYTSIRVALRDLRAYTGMSLEQLAAKIEINVSSLRMIESRGGLLHGEQCERCATIARDFRYLILAEFFVMEGMNNLRKQRQRKPQGMDESGISNSWK